MNNSMNNKTYKVQSILKEFGKYNMNLLIETKNKNFEINFNKYVIPHLLGLQYMGEKKLKGYECLRMIKRYNLSDQEILNIVEKNDNSKYHDQKDNVEKRINTFEMFMKSLEKGIVVEKTLPTQMIVNYLIIQTKEGNYHHLGILSGDNGALLESYDNLEKDIKDIMKTYFVEDNKDYYNKSKIFENITNISYYNEQQEEYLPFSFDIEKQSKLDEVAKIDKNYDYHEALNKSIEEIKKEKQAFMNLKKTIIDYYNYEFSDTYDYDDFDKLYPDLNHIALAYTDTPDGMHEIQYELNLNDKVGIQYVDDLPIRVDYFKDENMSDQQAIDHMTEAMECSSFDDLVFVKENDLKKSLGLEIDDDGNFYKSLEKNTQKSKGTVVLDDDWER
jgi:hypothetical protein